MALTFWISPLVQDEDGAWLPMAVQIISAIGPAFHKWETTSGNINLAPNGNRYAVGVSDTNAEQQAAIEGHPDMASLSVSDRMRAGRNIPPPIRAKIDDLLSRICGDAPIGDDETQDTLLNRIINRAHGTSRDDFPDILLGLKDISVKPKAQPGHTILFRDSFTVTGDTNIDAYPAGSPDYQYGSVGSGSNATVSAVNDRVESVTTASHVRLIDAAAPSGDQEAIIRGNTATGNENAQVMVRHTLVSGLGNAYRIDWRNAEANELRLSRADNDIVTSLASADRGLSGAATRFFRIRALGTGATVSLLGQIGDTAVLTVDDVDAARKMTGAPGFGLATPASSWKDDFQVTDGAAQKMYFPLLATAGASPAFSTGWVGLTEAVRRRWSKTKGSSTLLSGAQITINASGNSRDADRMYVSDPLDGDQIVMGTIKGQIGVRELAASDNVNRLNTKLYVTNTSGGTIRGTLLALGSNGILEEYATTNRNTAMFGSGTTATLLQTITPVSALDGDRIIIEIGHQVVAGGGTSPNANSIWGETGTDLPENATATGRGVPWLEFISSLAFQSTGATGAVTTVRRRQLTMVMVGR